MGVPQVSSKALGAEVKIKRALESAAMYRLRSSGSSGSIYEGNDE